MTMDDHKIKSDLEKMYDATASIYGVEYRSPAGYYFMWRKIKTVLDLGGFGKGANLLEVGCANGPYTFEFARLGFKMTGLDLSERNIEEANKRAKINTVHDIKFIVGDAENLSFQNNTFEGIISLSTLRYVPSPQKAINEMYRAVQKGKNIVIDFPNKRSPWFNCLKPWLMGKKHIHDHQYTTNEINQMLQNAGFREIEAKRILYTPKATPSAMLGFMKGIDFIGERMPLINEFAAIIVCKGIK